MESEIGNGKRKRKLEMVVNTYKCNSTEDQDSMVYNVGLCSISVAGERERERELESSPKTLSTEVRISPQKFRLHINTK